MVARPVPGGKCGGTARGRRTVLTQLLALPVAGAVRAAAVSPARPGSLTRLPVGAGDGLADRKVQVWLPPDFDRRQSHAVLYMHDGQMLFDPAGTWNGKAWQVDITATTLLGQHQLRPFIIVGIDNDPQRRHAEYFPQAALQHLQPPTLRSQFINEALGARPAADAYLRWIVTQVKPAVDDRYPTLPGHDNTFMMGSSMGGLISLYAACQYPQVFGGVAALSTHWIGSFERNTQIPAALRQYLENHLPPPAHLRLYLDRGTQGLDALYDDAQRDIDVLLHKRGYSDRVLQSRVFEGATHDEVSWAARVDQPLRWLLG